MLLFVHPPLCHKRAHIHTITKSFLQNKTKGKKRNIPGTGMSVMFTRIENVAAALLSNRLFVLFYCFIIFATRHTHTHTHSGTDKRIKWLIRLSMLAIRCCLLMFLIIYVCCSAFFSVCVCLCMYVCL